MRHFVSFLTIFFSLAGTIVRAQDGHTVPGRIVRLTDSLAQQFAPDRRTALFDIAYTPDGSRLAVRGVTTSQEAHDRLLRQLKAWGYRVDNKVRILPDSVLLAGKPYGVVNLSVANLRAQPDYGAEMVTQALLGTPVRLLEGSSWYHIQTPDSYLSWVIDAAVTRMTKTELEAWNHADKLVVTSHFAFVYSAPDRRSQTVSDIVSGCRLRLLADEGDFFRVAYPDGRTGFVHRDDGQPEHQWRSQLRQDATALISTAFTLMGIPYLWAGMSAKGMDCSGFVRTVFFLHDIVLPRDASQMALVGERVDVSAGYDALQSGDLLFFGRKATDTRPERVIHVAIYLGGKRFIHSLGSVHVGSLDPIDPLFDEYNTRTLLYGRRVLPYVNRMEGIMTTGNNPFYQ